MFESTQMCANVWLKRALAITKEKKNPFPRLTNEHGKIKVTVPIQVRTGRIDNSGLIQQGSPLGLFVVVPNPCHPAHQMPKLA